jgi:hypothetical protein
MSQILKDLNKLAEKMGAPVVGQNISEQVRAISTFYGGTSHGANINERINEVRQAYHGGGGEATLIEKTISANGTYLAANDSADGYSKVNVNVQSPLTPYLMSHGEEYIVWDRTDIDIGDSPLLQMDYYIAEDNTMSDEWHGLFGCGRVNVDKQFSAMYNPSIGTNGSYTWQMDYGYSTTDAIYGKCQVNFGNNTANVINSTQASTAFIRDVGDDIDRTKFAVFARYLSDLSDVDATGIIMGVARLRIWDTNNKTLIVDMVPAINPSTNKACLYDRVTQAYYGNSNLESSTDFEIVEM